MLSCRKCGAPVFLLATEPDGYVAEFDVQQVIGVAGYVVEHGRAARVDANDPRGPRYLLHHSTCPRVGLP